MAKYFGTDGVRGVAGDTLTSEMAFRIGQSLKDTFNLEAVAIAKDTRESSPVLAQALCAGAMSVGVDVYDGGVLPTPAIAHYTRVNNMIGIMVTASHNSFEDNGIKIFDKGFKMSDEAEAKVEAFIDGKKPSKQNTFGKRIQTDDIKNVYSQLFEPYTEEINQTVCLDMANGATYAIAQELLASQVDEIVSIADAPDGFNINAGCGSTHMENITEAVKKHKCDIGFAFDGDGDRVLAVDHNGYLYDGDMLLYVLATYMKDNNQLNKNTVVLTKMSNPGIERALKNRGIKVVRTDVGDKYVTREMFKSNYSLGGESSGHIIIKDKLQTGDGLLVAANILNILQDLKRPLDALIRDVTLDVQKTINVKNVDKSVVNEKRVKNTVKDVRKTLGNDALILVRPSGTEPVVRLTVAHKEADKVDDALNTLKTSIIEAGRDGNV